MRNRDEEQGKLDPNLDIPSEANTRKHINFLDSENEPPSRDGNKDDSNEKRRRDWEPGLKEGKEVVKLEKFNGCHEIPNSLQKQPSEFL